ncbi:MULTISPECIES: peptidoglycan editing factor PgeF [Giesbergeria]|uniref:Purine nucleoside phosphorylase n=1 Tax=Giesbergeria sinuosa TaxID=80883 RepID=A0ABV9QEH8_9BURK
MPSSSALSAFHPDWICPDWPAPAHVQALCTSRAGGVSAAPYDSLNLGDHVGDLPEDVHTNRKRLQTALQAHLPAAQAVFLRQVHGTHTVDLDAGLSDGICADACVATMPAKVCTIMVADCLPVLLTDLQGRAVAAAHAGWRGLADGVLESVFDAFCTRLLHETTPANRWALAQSTLAWLGPCIGPLAFEVGEEVRAAFCAHDSRAALHFQPQTDRPGKYLADLAALARQRLQALGIRQISGNDSTSTWCTVGNPSRFFSHRRDAIALGGSGRMAVCVWRHGGV